MDVGNSNLNTRFPLPTASKMRNGPKRRTSSFREGCLVLILRRDNQTLSPTEKGGVGVACQLNCDLYLSCATFSCRASSSWTTFSLLAKSSAAGLAQPVATVTVQRG